MSLSLISGAFWVLAATLVAMLPMRLQWVPGLALLLAAPVLLAWIGLDHGPGWIVAGALAFISMYRRPLGYLLFRLLPRKTEDIA
ncbi:DUF2484 family protein [Silicimonas sp. MF1-12-2]|uniref:DUF2484 family protein n=1 Tax=Silicimonas sp. MF1-12-2 TaxID=3384793 RepID=UPI0039B4E55B